MQIDYKKIGFKSGLEIHQQLDSHKLFCNCPSILRTDEPAFEIKRKLHAIAGESGEIDVAAKHEAGLKKEFIYQAYDTTCLVELDEEPPHQINQEALEIALQIALLLNAKIFPITQIMRKTVIDGSNTSGFQRTVQIAYDGYVETLQGKVRIDGIFLEEDSARKVEQNENSTTFKLDRLGIPLVEIATAPDIKNAEHAKETALKLGDILRSTKVRRGIGTIRQDINISIKGTNRVELKGFQNPKIMIQTVDNEIARQQKILEKIKENKNSRGQQRDDLQTNVIGNSNKKGGSLTKSKFSGNPVNYQANLQKEFMPQVRNVLANATSEFLRPMPGSARMYPETDLPLLKISRDFINKVKKNLPKLKSKTEQELKQKGLNEDMIRLLFKQNKVQEFKELLLITNKPQLIAKIILMFPKEISKREKINLKKVEESLEDNYIEILNALNKNKIKESEIKEIMLKLVKGSEFKDAIKKEKVDMKNIEEKIRDIIKTKPGLSANAYMGLVMKEFGGKVGGNIAMQIIKKYLL